MVRKVLLGILIIGYFGLSLTYCQDLCNSKEKFTPFTKAGRGVLNLSFGWTEIARQLILAKQKDNEFASCGLGLVKGVVYGIGRSIYGIYEITTFIAPPYHSFIKPDYVLDFDLSDENCQRYNW